jgi:hypothetical protein
MQFTINISCLHYFCNSKANAKLVAVLAAAMFFYLKLSQTNPPTNEEKIADFTILLIMGFPFLPF